LAVALCSISVTLIKMGCKPFGIFLSDRLLSVKGVRKQPLK
jgi:hypothetical protein